MSSVLRHRATFARSLRRFLTDDTGQDLLEYAILTALVAVGSVALFSALALIMRQDYENVWQQSAQDNWEPCAPNGGACP